MASTGPAKRTHNSQWSERDRLFFRVTTSSSSFFPHFLFPAIPANIAFSRFSPRQIIATFSPSHHSHIPDILARHFRFFSPRILEIFPVRRFFFRLGPRHSHILVILTPKVVNILSLFRFEA